MYLVSASADACNAVVLQVAGIPEDQARRLFLEMITAVDYCHRLGIVNRDIKLDNLMLSSDGPDAVLKICDFGGCLKFGTRLPVSSINQYLSTSVTMYCMVSNHYHVPSSSRC